MAPGKQKAPTGPCLRHAGPAWRGSQAKTLAHLGEHKGRVKPGRCHPSMGGCGFWVTNWEGKRGKSGITRGMPPRMTNCFSLSIESAIFQETPQSRQTRWLVILDAAPRGYRKNVAVNLSHCNLASSPKLLNLLAQNY